MKKQFAVIGLGRFGSSVAHTLALSDCDVIAIDKNADKVRDIADVVTMALELDASDERAIKETGVQNVDAAVVSIGENIEANILVVMILKEMGIKNIVARAISDLHGKVLLNLGVDRVVYPMKEVGARVAGSLIKPQILELIELTEEYRIVEMPAPKILWNKTLRESNLRVSYGISIIAIKGVTKAGKVEKDTWNINPMPDDIISKDDILVVLGSNKDIDKLS